MLARGPEHARVADQMAARRRDDADEPPQERDRFEHQVRAAVRPWSLELIRDTAVIRPRQSLLRERRTRAVSTLCGAANYADLRRHFVVVFMGSVLWSCA